MRILVACEESQVVCKAFRAKGHEAYSCDIIDCSGGHPEWHVKGDALSVIQQERWDMIIAHPPCTYLCRQAARWYEKPETKHLVDAAAGFFNKIITAPCDKVVIENPIPHKRAKEMIGDYTQIIKPNWFGHDYSKTTCLWIKGLPNLKPTKHVEITYYTTPNGRRYTRGWYFTPRNSKARSKTFQGIADAMADQWG